MLKQGKMFFNLRFLKSKKMYVFFCTCSERCNIVVCKSLISTAQVSAQEVFCYLPSTYGLQTCHPTNLQKFFALRYFRSFRVAICCFDDSFAHFRYNLNLNKQRVQTFEWYCTLCLSSFSQVSCGLPFNGAAFTVVRSLDLTPHSYTQPLRSVSALIVLVGDVSLCWDVWRCNLKVTCDGWKANSPP